MSLSNPAGLALNALQPDAVQAWLKARGWRDEGPEGPAARGYAKPDAGAEILVPTRPTAPDFLKFMSILVERIADIEAMTPEAVVNDLGAAGYDVLRVRVVAAEGGSLDLDRALTVVQQARATLQAAAKAAASTVARRSYVGRQAESVTKLLEHVRIGQTERGSYVVPLLVPYAFDPSETPVFHDWFARRSMRKLASGLDGVDRALAQVSDSQLSEPFAREAGAGVSADLCQSLGKLLSETGDVELSIRWAVAQPDALESRGVRFSVASAPTLLRAAQALREQDPPPPEPIVGMVTKLDDRPTGTLMVVEAEVDGRWRRVELVLNESFRSLASDAFKEYRPVVVEGPIQRQGKRLVMTSVDAFSLLEVEDTDEA